MTSASDWQSEWSQTDCSSILVAVVVIVVEVRRRGRSSVHAPADGIIAGRPSRALQTICGKKNNRGIDDLAWEYVTKLVWIWDPWAHWIDRSVDETCVFFLELFSRETNLGRYRETELCVLDNVESVEVLFFFSFSKQHMVPNERRNSDYFQMLGTSTEIQISFFLVLRNFEQLWLRLERTYNEQQS